jgi:hypothetical protein
MSAKIAWPVAERRLTAGAATGQAGVQAACARRSCAVIGWPTVVPAEPK